jgi:hypothetical protein
MTTIDSHGSSWENGGSWQNGGSRQQGITLQKGSTFEHGSVPDWQVDSACKHNSKTA